MKEKIKKQLKKIPFLIRIKKLLTRKRVFSNDQMEEMVFGYFRYRFQHYSGAFTKSKAKDMAYLTWLYHVVEKGLAMPEMKLGFGNEKIKELSKLIKNNFELYGDSSEVRTASAVLLEYKSRHEQLGFKLNDDINHCIEVVKELFPDIEPEQQVVTNYQKYFKDINESFPVFIKSRHSVRNFSSSPLNIQQIIDSIELAKYAPSACNRQPSKVHIVDNKSLINKCLSLQNGNRGFGHLADKLLIITGEIGTLLGSQEFLDLNTNVGIFIMNLSYALHYNKVAHCILNWYVEPSVDKKLRKIIDIPDSENIVAFIVCGNAPKEDFRLVSSPRITTDSLYTIHR